MMGRGARGGVGISVAVCYWLALLTAGMVAGRAAAQTPPPGTSLLPLVLTNVACEHIVLRVNGVAYRPICHEGRALVPLRPGPQRLEIGAPGMESVTLSLGVSGVGSVLPAMVVPPLRSKSDGRGEPQWGMLVLVLLVGGVVAAIALVAVILVRAQPARARTRNLAPLDQRLVPALGDPGTPRPSPSLESTRQYPRARPAGFGLLPPIRPQAAAEVFGAYRIESLLAAGGIATVSVAVDTRSGQRVALKRIRQEHLVDRDLVRRFLLEGDILRLLNTRYPDAAIVRVHDWGRADQNGNPWPYLALELLQGVTLERQVRAQGRLSPALALAVIREVAQALACAHNEGIFHRDLSPDNIFLLQLPNGPRSRLQLKIIDFGVAKLQASQHGTIDGAIHGKPSYMSPEQCAGQALDGRTDVYSLGHVLYFALEGRPAFWSRNPLEVLEMHRRRAMPAPTRCGDRVVALVQSMCEKDPAARPSMHFVAEALGRMVRG